MSCRDRDQEVLDRRQPYKIDKLDLTYALETLFEKYNITDATCLKEGGVCGECDLSKAPTETCELCGALVMLTEALRLLQGEPPRFF